MTATRAAATVKRRRVGFVAGGLVLALVAANFWFRDRSGSAAARERGGPPPPAVPITLTTAKAEDVDVTLDAIGRVTPVATVALTSRVAGVLTKVDYKEGQSVKRNELLAVIDPRPYQAAVMQAQGQLARDQALLANAHLDLNRYRNAYLKHAIPEQQVATQEATVREYEGIAQLDQGALDAAQVNLGYTRIVSPIDGRVGLRNIDPGNIVQADGAQALVTITQLHPITVIFTLSQDDLPQVAAGMRGGTALRVEAFDRVAKRPIAEGTLLTIDNEVDPATGTFRLKGVFPNQDEALWPGAFVNIRLVTRVERNAVTVPARAVQDGPNGSYLFVVDPNLTVAMRAVRVGQVGDGVAVIAAGLAAGEKVVLDGQYRLEPGSRVTIERAPAARS
ncbi:MAG: efflux RND transporter periplasmic adaptor subunit [Opitutaceae bacterium]